SSLLALGPEAFRGFDLMVDEFRSEPSGPGTFRTLLRVKRVRDAAPTTSADGWTVPAVPVMIRFADGREIHEMWDGRQPQVTLDLESAEPAVLASGDPRAVLLIDEDRSNNVRSLRPRLTLAGLQRIANWFVWLQD